MLQEEFEKLMTYMKSAEMGNVNMEEMMGQVMGFFGGLKTDLMSASPEERQEIFSKLSGMYSQIMDVSKGYAEKLGMSQQELLQLADDMKNFTPEQKELMEKTKSQMVQEVQDIASYIQEKEGGEKPKLGEKESGPKEAPRRKKTRSKWVRS